MTDPNTFPHHISPLVQRATRYGSPIVALESAVITHGLPKPHNLQVSQEMERVILECGATPAITALLDGVVHIGLNDAELSRLVNEKIVRKLSRRDFAAAILKKESGGTTVAGTLFIAHQFGIDVFATGGIGGIHEVETFDISADLQALSDIPMIVVCAGAKAILNLPATLEYLETMSIPVIGYGTDEFPAFYSRQSGLPVTVRLDSAREITRFASTHWGMGMKSAVLVCQPLPQDVEIPRAQLLGAIDLARSDAFTQGFRGQTLTPYLLKRIAELTNGASLKANLALLRNNARLAAQIACSLSSNRKDLV